jgi:hypothetical protein
MHSAGRLLVCGTDFFSETFGDQNIQHANLLYWVPEGSDQPLTRSGSHEV